jgi:argininosuccinate lyase
MVTPTLVAEAGREVLGRPVHLGTEQLRAALDPWAFVRARTIPGGPAPEIVRAHAAQMRARLAEDVAWRERREAQIDEARAERQSRAAALSA